MSDETPRELTEQETDLLESLQANDWSVSAGGPRVRGIVVHREQLRTLLHMARRGARDRAALEQANRALAWNANEIARLRSISRAAMAARLTDRTLYLAREAFAYNGEETAMRHVLLDALTGVDHG